MENSLLFVNQNREVIREFLDAVNGYDFHVDTADNGLDAVAYLKKRNYKVVITGMDLAGADGSKLIAYLNQRFPQTVCMVYTRRLELAHLKLLINERKVFRIFQKTADLKKEVSNAIMEAFAYYDVQEREYKEGQIMEQKQKSVRRQLEELKRALTEQESRKKELEKFLEAMLKVYAGNVKIRLPREDRRLLFAYEEKLISHLLEAPDDWAGLEELKKQLFQSGSADSLRRLSPVIDGISQALQRE